jgi:NAD(P)-dependent dehydrogenase (short-subunit alcohol dehydrogenase family)
MQELSGQFALVTGGASGIGKATVEALVRQGAAVAVLDRDEAGARIVADAARSAGGHALAIGIDLAKTSLIPGAVAGVLKDFGRLDILVNCAGLTGHIHTILDMDEACWDLVHDVNLKAPMLLMKHVAKHMIERGGGGRIVNVSSSSAFRARSRVAYASAKAALVHLTHCAAAEFGPHGINVNAVAPGLTATPMTLVQGMSALEAQVKSGRLENFLHRVAVPEDVAAAIVFLCQPGSRQITGQCIHTSAGAVIQAAG